MRVGIFTDSYPPYINGVSTSVVMLKKALEKKGHQVYIVTVNDSFHGYKFEDNNRTIRIPGIPVGIYDYRLTRIYPVKIINKIKKWNLDVIHSQTEFGVGIFARIISKQFDIPLVHTYHTLYEDYVHYITKGYFNKSSKKVVQYLTKFYCDKTATELIVPTKKIYSLFKEKYKYERNIHIVPTGIEIERFFKENINSKDVNQIRKELEITERDFIILFIGRLGKEKNIEFLIENQLPLVKKYPFCKLIIIGDGPDAPIYEKLVNKLKLQNNVKLIGKKPFDDIPKYYQIANVFATASKSETQGLTVIEAMAASVPVVAVEDDSFKEIIISDLNGYLFKNKKQYRKIMEVLIENRQKTEYLGRQARNSSETYSSKYFADRVLKVYESALKGKSKNKSFASRIKNVIKKGWHGK